MVFSYNLNIISFNNIDVLSFFSVKKGIMVKYNDVILALYQQLFQFCFNEIFSIVSFLDLILLIIILLFLMGMLLFKNFSLFNFVFFQFNKKFTFLFFAKRVLIF